MEWCRSFATPSGVAHPVSILCFVGQAVCIDIFLVRYVSSMAVFLTLFGEVPVLLHLAWFWREESALRSAPSQWATYSWIHAAKVVVLFVRVMPRLPTETAEASIGGFSVTGLHFDDKFLSPSTLSNLLLLTPVLYALQMFRTSKAIFGPASKHITVDLLMHYDMLWHVVIDMVDQVDMFQFARLAEWVGTGALDKHHGSLVAIQTVVPFLLFLSIVLQAQAFPGVVVDAWTIPDPPTLEELEMLPPPKGQEVAEMRARTGDHVTQAPHTSLATLRERSVGSTPSGTMELGSEASGSAPAGQSPSAGATSSGNAVDARGSQPPPAPQLRPASSAPLADLRLPPEQAPVAPGSAEPAAASEQASGMAWARISMLSTRKRVGMGMLNLDTPAATRDLRLSWEKARRRRLCEIIQSIQRQSIIIARKRSALISIFFVDIPFLSLRIWLWAILDHKYFWGFGVKNAICIALNVMQYTLVSLASRAAFSDIQQHLAVYYAKERCHNGGAGAAESGDVAWDTVSVAPPTPSDVVSVLSTPQQPLTPTRESPFSGTAATGRKPAPPWWPFFPAAQRRVRRELVRSTNVCVHFWSLAVAFFAGFLLTKGVHFVGRVFKWVEDPEMSYL